MTRTRILFADDHIPYGDIPNDEVRKKYSTQFNEMDKALTKLHESDYEVDVANTYQDAMNKAETGGYDIAVIDLGWFADWTLPEKKRGDAGWDISDALKNNDKKMGKKTPQIMYSARFLDKPYLSIRAAEKQRLPLFKKFDKAGHEVLRAAITFTEANLLQADPFLVAPGTVSRLG